MATKTKTATKAKKATNKAASKSAAQTKAQKSASLFARLVANVTDEVLHETPVRAVKLLQGIASRPRIMLLMSQRGYGQREHDQGWSLVRPVLKLSPTVVRAAARTPQAGAIAALDAWDEPNFAILRTALVADLAPVGTFLLADLQAQVGAAAVEGVARLLERLSDLEIVGPLSREAGIAKDVAKAAMKKIDRRGFTRDERARLAGLVSLAMSAPDPGEATDPNDEIERHNQLVLLRQWFDETTAIARTQVKRRDDLILLGLAERKSPTKPGGGTPGT